MTWWIKCLQHVRISIWSLKTYTETECTRRTSVIPAHSYPEMGGRDENSKIPSVHKPGLDNGRLADPVSNKVRCEDWHLRLSGCHLASTWVLWYTYVHLHSHTGACTHTYTHTLHTHKHITPSITEPLSLDRIKPEGGLGFKTFVTSKSFLPFESIFSSERCIINTSKGYYGMTWNNVSKTTLKIAKLRKLRDLSFNEHRVPAVGCEPYEVLWMQKRVQ